MNLERATEEGKSPVNERIVLSVITSLPPSGERESTARHVKTSRNMGGSSPKAKYLPRPIVN